LRHTPVGVADHSFVGDLLFVELSARELLLEFRHSDSALLRDEIDEVFDEATFDRVGLGSDDRLSLLASLLAIHSVHLSVNGIGN
jgi:hypothetical protein